MFISISLLGFAQEEENEQELTTINSQFNEVIESSNNYQDYKVVKQNQLLQLQRKTVERIKSLNAEINNSKKTIEKQKAEVNSLNAELTQTQNNLNKITEEKDEISFFGIATNKGTYQTIMWIIILVLVLILVFFVYKYKQSNIQTKEAKINLAKNETEFDEYRKQALEKQQKLGRQLQDEKNKQNKNKL
ncbi:hypothetical protein KW502_06695 [Mesonia sp. JHPTF-M18]|uniref:tRNA (Guanine-N1)-methyltransferase n=1 Tax=Mesonia aestuariivivens TaxID=2796128 RepID=A0ABS6W2W8_9FLAO|nr:hypothetical protein [Mesonia aestuariivivens]